MSTGSDRRETIIKPGSVVEGWMESVPWYVRRGRSL